MCQSLQPWAAVIVLFYSILCFLIKMNKAVFLDYPYLHFSNIQRSSFKKADSMVMQRNRKIRHEIGSKFTKDFKYPEVFYKEKPDLVPNPWIAMSNNYRIRAIVETPLRKLKRRIRWTVQFANIKCLFLGRYNTTLYNYLLYIYYLYIQNIIKSI